MTTSMRRIYKYEVPITDRPLIVMPEGAEVLSVQVQYGVPQLWVLVDPTQLNMLMRFALRAIGQEFHASEVGRYVGTFQLQGGALVYHLFFAGDA